VHLQPARVLAPRTPHGPCASCGPRRPRGRPARATGMDDMRRFNGTGARPRGVTWLPRKCARHTLASRGRHGWCLCASCCPANHAFAVSTPKTVTTRYLWKSASDSQRPLPPEISLPCREGFSGQLPPSGRTGTHQQCHNVHHASREVSSPLSPRDIAPLIHFCAAVLRAKNDI
jgi:hypothetical protein